MKTMISWALAALVAACAHSPDPTFFALSPQRGSLNAGVPALKVELRRAALPGYLDRPHIVRRATAEQLELEGDERWGAPLDEMVSATLAEDLAQRLPSSVVYTESGAISAEPDVRVEVQLFRFERAASGAVELLAEVAVHSTRSQHSSTRRFSFTRRPASGRTSAIVSTLSELLGQLSDGISTMIVAESATPAAVSPPPPAGSRTPPSP